MVHYQLLLGVWQIKIKNIKLKFASGRLSILILMKIVCWFKFDAQITYCHSVAIRIITIH
jgi:hypothetical protein